MWLEGEMIIIHAKFWRLVA